MSKNWKFLLIWVIFFAFSFSAVTQKQDGADPQAIVKLLETYRGQGTSNLPVIYKNPKGYIRFLSAPEGGYFETSATGQKSFDAQNIAKTYMENHFEAFTSGDEKIKFEVTSEKEADNFINIRLNQTYNSIPVFGAGVCVRVTKDGKILALSCEVARDLSLLSALDLSKGVPIDAGTAEQLAIQHIIRENQDVRMAKIESLNTPNLMIYDPSLLKMPGAPTAVYDVLLSVKNSDKRFRVLVDTYTGEIRLCYLLRYSVIDREIYDANGSYNIPNTIARKEGDNPTGISDVDNAFDYLGDAYNFFATNHKRDSYDDKGAPLKAVVRVPILNAYWDPSLEFFWFGSGFTVDDVIAHEYSHPVIEDKAGLIYFGEPGAITESLCDTWGEFVDLTNERGLDSTSVRWLIGEELPAGVPWENSSGTALRNMKDPTLSYQPDRYTSPNFVSTTNPVDNGGVHTNSGVGNKLTYLLTDGDTFNGEQVKGFGIVRTSKLYYDALDLLPPVADYSMLALALNASAVAQGLSLEDRYNLSRAMKAVEILPAEAFEMGAHNFRATSLLLDDDTPAIMLTWTPPEALDYRQVILVKKAGSYPTGALDGEQLFTGKGDRYLDVNVSTGIEYFYALFVDMENLPPMELYDSAVAGEMAPLTLTQEFVPGIDPRIPVMKPIFYSQIRFIPTGAPINPPDGNKFLGGYSNYDATFTPEIFSFPVKRQDATGSSYTIPLSTDGLVKFDLTNAQFPFFGKKFGTIYVGSNGYIAFEPVPLESTKNQPSLASHFAIPRISFLFTDLAPDSAGEVWTRELNDRFVITFENVPKKAQINIPNPISGATPGSSVQVELFFSGHIRITYLQLDTDYCVVGLSDGRGAPPDPFQIFPEEIPYSIDRYVDFPKLPPQPTKLHFQPSPIYKVLPDQTITFEVISQYYTEPAPVLWATWLIDDTPPFSNVGNGKGKFSWTPTREYEGTHYIRVIARQNNRYAYQDIPIIVNPVTILPQAVNLRISSQSPAEDTTASRVVAAGRPLVASYDYVHPLMVKNPTQYMEGPSILYWFRNHETIPALTNYRTVPPNVTKGGDIWYFRVIPITISGLVGEEAMSPIIYVVGQPQISSVYPNKGKTTGGELVRIRGTNFAGLIEIKFGGVSVPNFRLITETEIEVTTPQHQPGLVDIYIRTAGGASTLSQAFEYYEETQKEQKKEEKKRFIVSCGENYRTVKQNYIGDILFILLSLFLLISYHIKRERVRF